MSTSIAMSITNTQTANTSNTGLEYVESVDLPHGKSHSASRQPTLSITDLRKTYGRGESSTQAVGGVSFELYPNELVTVVGPSGCGKSTILRCIAGLLTPSSGSIRIAGEQISGPANGLGVVFQDYSRSLFPWLSVGANVALPLKARHVSKSERTAIVARALSDVGLAGKEDKYPWELSGGMQQRVAIARALVSDPSLLLLDEPFAAVDAQTRSELQDLVRQLRVNKPDIAILFITHDIDEAVYLADRVIVLSTAPTTIRKEVVPHLPEHRDQLTTKNLPQFNAARTAVLETITTGR